MNIMFLADSLSDGGAERVTALLASRFSGKYGVSVYCLERKCPEYEVSDSVRKYYCKSREEGYRRRIKELIFIEKAINREKPDIVISLAGYIGNALLEIANVFHRVPIVLSERSDPYHYPVKTRGRIVRNLTYWFCDGVVFQTKGAKEFFNKHVQKKSCIIMNPVKKEYALRENNIERKIVNCSRLSTEKNLPMLIDAFSIISKKYPDYELHIYGEGAEHQILQDQIKALQLERKVVLHGFVENVYEKIKNAAMYVSTSNYEGMSNSMLEALAMGIPTICTDCPSGGARMVIRDSKNGLLIPVGNKGKLVEAIQMYIENPQLAEKYGKNGKRIIDSMSEEKIADKWERYIVATTKKKRIV